MHKNISHVHSAVWLVIAFLLGAAVMGVLLSVRGTGLTSQAYESGMFTSGSINDCYDASMSSSEALACFRQFQPTSNITTGDEPTVMPMYESN